MHMTASALICTIVITIVVHSVNVDSAPLPLISSNDVRNNSTINSSDGLSLVDPEDGLFEGDIKISEDLIRKYYNLSSMPGGEEPATEFANGSLKEDNGDVEKRAALSDNLRLYKWTNAIIPYQFSSGISTDVRLRIRSAMDHWEDNTCLRFPARNGESDYVYYDNGDVACWSYIGKHGGRQTINVHRVCRFGSVVHEIGHAVGFWHEQSRPDRDDYVRINISNVEAGMSNNFMKLTNTFVNSRGSTYDYGSIMHYPARAFVRDNCGDCKTIEVTNTAAFEAQGSPRIGQRDGLSVRDVQQANSLYSCPTTGRGVNGTLVVYIRSGQSLPDTSDSFRSFPDPYIKLTAIDSSGTKYTGTTAVRSGTSPEWNENLNFPNREWQFFRIQVWDDEAGADDEMSISETVTVTHGAHNDLRHYSRLDSSTNGYVLYDYTLQ